MRTSAATSRGSSTTPARRTAGSRSSTRRFGSAPGATSAEAKSSPTIIRLTASARFRAAAVLAVGIKSNAMFIAAAAVAALALAADLPTGQVVPDVACAADSTQSYALYLPHDYNADRAWPVIFAFDPGGRGRVPVERYQTAGTEDFNHLEMRQLDRALTSPHRLAVFEGGHVWLSSELAIDAVEWMELQAMKSGLKPRDDREIDQIFAKRQAAVDAAKVDKDTFLALQAIADDFDRLKDVRAIAVRAAELGRDKNVRAALKRDRDEDDREESML